MPSITLPLMQITFLLSSSLLDHLQIQSIMSETISSKELAQHSSSTTSSSLCLSQPKLNHCLLYSISTETLNHNTNLHPYFVSSLPSLRRTRFYSLQLFTLSS